MEGIVSKRMTRVNYEEGSDNEEESSIMDIILESSKEVEEQTEKRSKEVEKQTEKRSFGELNLKKQYRRALIAAQNRVDWKHLEKKNVPKGEENKNSIYFYLEMHPGIFQLAANEISKFLCQDDKIEYKGGQSDHYGAATTKDFCNFYLNLYILESFS